MRVGFIGLGNLGGVLAPHIAAGGFEVAGYDILPARLRALGRRGVRPARSAEEAARGARFVFLCLPTEAAVEGALRGPRGVLAGLGRGAIVADLGTVLPATSRRLARFVKEAGGRFLDTPISGNRSISARKGGTVMAGGAAADYKRILPVLRSFSRAQYRMGPVGAGVLMKIVMNTVSELNRTVLAEGLTLGMRGGIAGRRLLEVLASGTAHSKQLDNKGPRMIAGRFGRPDSALAISIKDAELMLQTGRDVGAPLPLTALRLLLYQAAAQMGHAGDDPASVIAFYQKMAGRPRRRSRRK